MAGTRGEDAAGLCNLPAGSGADPAPRALSGFSDARVVPAGREFLLDYDGIEAFCVAGLAGRACSTRGTYRSALYRLAAARHGPPGQRPPPFPGSRAPAPDSPAERAGPAARLVPVPPHYAGRARELARRAGSGFVFRPGPADRSYKNFVSNFTRGLTADPAAPRLSLRRARATFICHHLAAVTPVPVLLAITGITEAGSLARYARHVRGISSSKGALRARWRAERTP